MSFTIHTGSCYPASALEVLRNALYKFKTYLLTYLFTLFCIPFKRNEFTAERFGHGAFL